MSPLFNPQPGSSPFHQVPRPPRDLEESPYSSGGQSLLTEQTALRALVPVLFGILLLWNWRLSLALLAGSGTINLAALLRTQHWQQRLIRIQQLYLKGENLPMAFAVAGAIVATLGTYTGLSIWTQSSDRWLAVGSISQGLISAGIFYLLAWQVGRRPSPADTDPLDTIFQHMLDASPARRLLAARQLQRLMGETPDSPVHYQFVKGYLQTVLERETDRRVREQLLVVWQENFV